MLKVKILALCWEPLRWRPTVIYLIWFDGYRVSNFFYLVVSWDSSVHDCGVWRENWGDKNKVKTCGWGGQEVITCRRVEVKVSALVFSWSHHLHWNISPLQRQWCSRLSGQRNSFLKKFCFWKKHIPSFMTGNNRVHVNAKKHFNASMFETTRIAWSGGQKQRHSSDKQTNEQAESSMWSSEQIIETLLQCVDTLVTTSCLTLSLCLLLLWEIFSTL